MKKRIVINVNKDYYCIGCTDTTCSGSFYDFLCCCIEDKEYIKEQVPENWEELKSLCRLLKQRINKEIWEIKIEDEFIYVSKKWETKEICFTSAGNMVSNNGWDLLMTDLTSSRQWQIIKSLIGAE